MSCGNWTPILKGLQRAPDRGQVDLAILNNQKNGIFDLGEICLPIKASGYPNIRVMTKTPAICSDCCEEVEIEWMQGIRCYFKNINYPDLYVTKST